MNRIVVLINICLLLISCAQNKENNTKKIIRYNASNGITSLDPAFASNQDNIWAVSQLFNGLVGLDDRLKPVPDLAEKWEITDSGRTYIFHLKRGVFFHENPVFRENPRTVNASDFVYSFNRIRDKRTASPGAWIFSDRLADSAFEARGEYTLVIRLKTAYAPFLSILAMPYCSVVPHEVVEKYGKDFGRNPVGTGPFRYFLWEDNVKLIFHKNESYHEDGEDQAIPAVDALSISFIRSRESAFMEFLQGKLDFVGEIDPAFRSKILTKEGRLMEEYSGQYELHRSIFLNTEYLAISQRADPSSPLYYPEFRKALNLGIDKQKMIQFLRSGIGKPATHSFVPPALPGSITDTFAYDLDAAIELMNTVDPVIRAKEIVLTTTKDYEDLCIFLQNQWLKLGVNCKLDVVPSSHLKDAKRNGQLAFFRASWIADFADAENYLSCFISSNFSPDGPNYTYFSSSTYDSLYKAAVTESNEDTRLDIYQQMDRMIIESGVIIPLYYDETVWLTHNMTNVQTSPLNLPKFKYLSIR